MKQQTIFKVHREQRDRWTQVLNDTVRDGSLSFRATGLLVYLLSLPEDWKINYEHIASVKTEGRDAVITAFDELRKAGYITKEIGRDEGGKITGTIWHVFETANRPTEKPFTAEPFTGNPLLRSKEEKERKNDVPASPETDESMLDEGARKKDYQIRFDTAHEIYKAYPKKVGKKDAIDSIIKALKTIPTDQLTERVHAYAAAIAKWPKEKRSYVPNPSTWFNQGRWEDDPETWKRYDSSPSYKKPNIHDANHKCL